MKYIEVMNLEAVVITELSAEKSEFPREALNKQLSFCS